MTEIKTEAERWKSAYDIAHDQASANGAALLAALSLQDELVEALEMMSDALLKLSGMAGLITEKGVDRVLVDGEWHEGPLATAYIETVREIASGADRVLAQSQARSLLTRIKSESGGRGPEG